MKTCLLSGVILLFLLLCGCGEEDTSYRVIPGAPPSSVPLAQPPITQELADKVQLGMTLDEARQVLGSTGAQIPREVKHVQGVTRFAWRNADGSYLILDIKDNKIGMKQWRPTKTRK